MDKGRILTSPDDIAQVVRKSQKVAVLGISTDPGKASHQVAAYLKEAGYTIYPVRPGKGEVLGEPVVSSVDDLPGGIDILDVFRKPEQVGRHVDEAIRLKPRVFWMQLGIRNDEAAARLTEAGIDVVMDRCLKIEHRRYA